MGRLAADIGIFLGLAACLLPGLAVAAGAGKPGDKPLIRTKDGRLAARPLPAGAWCGPAVLMDVSGDRSSLADQTLLGRFATGARAAVLAECPRAEAIRFRATSGPATVLRAYAERATAWRLHVVATDVAPAAKVAFDARPADELRAIAVSDARFLNATVGLPATLAPATPESGAHAAWTAGPLVARMTIRARSGDGDLQGALRQALAPVVASCPQPQPPSLGPDRPEVVRATFVCRTAAGAEAFGAVVYANGDLVQVIELRATGADRDGGEGLSRVAAAYEAAIGGPSW